ncbi:ferritin-like domain-containing protein [Sphingomonas rubra]|uniref:Ferritin-like domain-containing protein n=1 Tax=Sphingomonas rubra TaxID=634430 RepID=A0A1I5TWC8_9SPHN|nr:ferritin-like domain-containing protein [Sphingomonas rubra]SFP87392.1 Ferritin-like domain-containing protein [Sphingomonas rubra]
MHDQQTVLEIIEKTQARRDQRRAFMRAAAGATVMAGGLSLLAACDDDDDTPAPTPTPTPTATSVSVDVQVLNFALQLEYLEAQFYSYAAFGTGLPAASLTGTGTQGAVQTGSGDGFPRAVNFSGDPLIGEYAREIAYDEIAHVNFLRSALGASATAQPAINISGTTTGAFTAAARAAGVIPDNSTSTFDPYLNPINFLLGAYIFEDVGVTAYKGASPLITNRTFLEAAAGILAAEAYHAGLVRTIIYNRGITNRDLITNATRISDARDSLDGSSDLDEGVGGTNIGDLLTGVSNIVPADGNAIAYSRTPQQVLSIVYLGRTPTAASFFPNGVNGSFTTTT